MRKGKIRFPLKLKEDVEARSLQELRENFDLEKIIQYFIDETLERWLDAWMLTDEAEKVRALDKGDKDIGHKLCEIFGVEPPEEAVDAEDIAWRTERENRLRQYTDDKEILAKVDYVAFDSGELYDILEEEDTNTIYLCDNSFAFNSGVLKYKNKRYVGIGKVEAVIESKTPLDFEVLGITFENVRFDAKYEKIQEDNIKEVKHTRKPNKKTYNNVHSTHVAAHLDNAILPTDDFHGISMIANDGRKFHVLGVDHLGIACVDLDEGKEFWTECMGIPCSGEETIEVQKVITAFYPMLDGSQIQLILATAYDSPIYRWIDANGGMGGIQHVALQVDNINAAIDELQKNGVTMIDKKTRRGVDGVDLAFIHPKSSGGVLLELCEHRDKRYALRKINTVANDGSKFHVLGVDHLGIACTDLEKGSEFWAEFMGVPCSGKETIAEQKITTVFHPMWNGCQIQLLVATAYDSPIVRWFNANEGKGGLQHVALRVDNLEAAIEGLRKKGVKMIDNTPRRGAGGVDIAFVHPRPTGGVLLELCEHRNTY